jgi:hypothetical protein
MKGKIPLTGSILLESNEAQWSLLASGLISEFRMNGIIELEPGRRVRVRILIKKALSQSQLYVENKCLTESNMGPETSGGLSRIHEHVVNFLSSKQWIMIGEIEGENYVPIIIVHYCHIEKTFYAHKKQSESEQRFFGTTPSLN